ncbi:serine/threonine-protein kinase [Streptantibioticus silvisoli]|uniref:Serine/threonine-protein kinase n=1 Tax=Streptantibioticus silvisoli TaxID=2705255 RepID=A0ABT6VSK2_9ACTN|nr:serine/threonine-protein kinase [Streptantibioticus silvisoli]MDI5961150.1 serine/threonine-protein kinase [Streptantibioticus silvisoli]
MSWVVPGYTHIRELGSGAGGRVLLARHEGTGSAVAIKYLGEELRGSEEFLTGFRAEARLLGDLGSPHVVRLWEYVEEPRGAAIVMELVDGISLRALLRAEGATGPEAALVVLKGSLQGLAAAHAAGVVHRDYKPENVLVAADGSSKLGDFGIAMANGGTGRLVGTPPYMAPERWTGSPAAPLADVYAATVTFFECLTGSRPYPGATTAELMVQHTSAPIPDDAAPEALRPLIRRGLAKEPADRPASAARFLVELEEVAGAAYGADWQETGQRELAQLAALLLFLFPSANGVAEGGTALATTVLGAAPPPARRPRRPAGRVLAAAILAVVALLLLGGYAMGALRVGTTAVSKAVAIPTGYASTGVAPGAASASPSASAGPGASASASPSVSATPSADVAPSASPDPAPDPTPTATPTTAASAGTTVSATAPPPPPTVHVTDLAIDVFDVDTSTYDGELYANATTDGVQPVVLTARWFVSPDGKSDTVVDTESVTVSGKTRYLRIPFPEYTFSRQYCGRYFGVTLTSSPAAADGSPSQSTYVDCPIQ